MRISQDLESIACLDANQMYERSCGYSKPVILRDGVKDWKALSSWSIDSFRSRFGDMKVRVAQSQDGVFKGDPVDGFRNVFREMLMSDYIDAITGKIVGNDNKKYYLMQVPLFGRLSALNRDIKLPKYTEGKEPYLINLWFGPKGNISPLHFDAGDNFLSQVIGTKKLLLFGPEQSEYLYPFPKNSPLPHMAQVDIDHPNFKKFPALARAEGTEAILNAGDMIFIPKTWWHQVYSLSLSISINFWY